MTKKLVTKGNVDIFIKSVNSEDTPSLIEENKNETNAN